VFDGQKLQEIREAKKQWEKKLESELQTKGVNISEIKSRSDIPAESFYTPHNLQEINWDYMRDVGFPGEYPYTASTSNLGYLTGPWRFNQYSGFSCAEETNKIQKRHLAEGARSLYLALDLPTQLGYDSDHPLAKGEVGRVGMALDTLADVETLINGLPIEEFQVAVTANTIGPIFFAMLMAAAEKEGVSFEKQKEMRIVVQNDCLKEYVSRGTQIFPPDYGVKFSCDLSEYVIKNEFKNTVPIEYGLYHIGEAGANSFQQVGFVLANAVEFIEELLRRGINVDDLPQARFTSFCDIDIFEGTAKHRALRRLFARTMRKRFGATNPRVMTATFFGGCQASQFTAQQPLNNITRGTLCALTAGLSGVETHGMAAYDEALCIPTAEAHSLALRSQQIVAYESGVMNTIDPLAGSYYVESLTSAIEKRAVDEFEKVQAMGGSVAAIKNGYMKEEIMRSAYEKQKKIETGEKVIVGVNKYRSEENIELEVMQVNPEEETKQIERLNRVRNERDNNQVQKALRELNEAAKGRINLVEPILAAVKAYATIGEIRNVLVSEFGECSR